jgi:hypothetical protein
VLLALKVKQVCRVLLVLPVQREILAQLDLLVRKVQLVLPEQREQLVQRAVLVLVAALVY